MKGLLEKLLQLSELQEVINCVNQGQSPVLVTGLGPVHSESA